MTNHKQHNQIFYEDSTACISDLDSLIDELEEVDLSDASLEQRVILNKTIIYLIKAKLAITQMPYPED